MDRSIFCLSGGEKQRIAFAAASMLGPRLLVLDEPTSNLDAGAIVQLHDMIAAMKEAGVTIVLAEHRRPGSPTWRTAISSLRRACRLPSGRRRVCRLTAKALTAAVCVPGNWPTCRAA